jgi:hypothetical protein
MKLGVHVFEPAILIKITAHFGKIDSQHSQRAIFRCIGNFLPVSIKLTKTERCHKQPV